MELKFNLDEIDAAAAQFIANAGQHRIFTFSGEMGAGKTTFICALCRHLGVHDIQGSPTFSIINDYLTDSGIQIYHMDLYRIKDTQEAIVAGVEDALMQGRYSFVEWPEKAAGLFDEDVVRCEIGLINHNQRILRINL